LSVDNIYHVLYLFLKTVIINRLHPIRSADDILRTSTQIVERLQTRISVESHIQPTRNSLLHKIYYARALHFQALLHTYKRNYKDSYTLFTKALTQFSEFFSFYKTDATYFILGKFTSDVTVDSLTQRIRASVILSTLLCDLDFGKVNFYLGNFYKSQQSFTLGFSVFSNAHKVQPIRCCHACEYQRQQVDIVRKRAENKRQRELREKQKKERNSTGRKQPEYFELSEDEEDDAAVTPFCPLNSYFMFAWSRPDKAIEKRKEALEKMLEAV